MPLKITKDMSSHLIKYIRTVKVSFNPFDARTTSARELLRQIHSERMLACNPKLKVINDIHSKPNAPRIQFDFVDGSDMAFNTEEFQVQEMMMDVWRTTMKIDDAFEMEGKNVDDV
ncbi:hypothetical protein ACHAXT_007326 [Thalassiosira profunda]